MKIEKIIKKIEDLDYCDAQVLGVNCEYFGDEVMLLYDYDDNDNVLYHFLGCVDINLHHSYKMDQPYRNLDLTQVTMFLQEVLMSMESDMYTFKINAYPLYLEIRCKDFEIKKVSKDLSNEKRAHAYL